MYFCCAMIAKRLFGLIGYPLTHSFSPAFFQAKFEREGINAAYAAFPLSEIAAFPMLLIDHPDLCGLNVTVPHKEAIMPFLTHVDEAAAEVGAVNCIRIENGTTTGYNTDVTGFRNSLMPLLGAEHRAALVLGNGGAAKAVTFALRALGMPYIIVSRHGAEATIKYEDVTPAILSTHRLVINTTPLGMFPNMDRCPPIPYDALVQEHLLYDLVYNPEQTLFLAKGHERGAQTKNGLEMLHIQALESWAIWNR